LLDEYPGAAAVGEVGDAQFGLELLGEYTKGETGAHMCYAFEFLEKSPLTAAGVAEVFERFDRVASEGWALPEADVAFENLQDPYGIEFWPEFKGRDGCRTPMVWEPSNSTGGFSDGAPWLPVEPEHLNRSVGSQETDPTAMLHFYRKALAFRAEHTVLSKGSQSTVQAKGDVVLFERSHNGATVLCAVNLSKTAQNVEITGAYTDISGDFSGCEYTNGSLTLNPWGAAFLRHTI
jgi:alpha-glucosidase